MMYDGWWKDGRGEAASGRKGARDGPRPRISTSSRPYLNPTQHESLTFEPGTLVLVPTHTLLNPASSEGLSAP